MEIKIKEWVQLRIGNNKLDFAIAGPIAVAGVKVKEPILAKTLSRMRLRLASPEEFFGFVHRWRYLGGTFHLCPECLVDIGARGKRTKKYLKIGSSSRWYQLVISDIDYYESLHKYYSGHILCVRKNNEQI